MVDRYAGSMRSWMRPASISASACPLSVLLHLLGLNAELLLHIPDVLRVFCDQRPRFAFVAGDFDAVF
jgi:hypothetical protein